VQGCPAQAKVFNLNIGKLDPKTISYHFIGYPDRLTCFIVQTSSWKHDMMCSLRMMESVGVEFLGK
jgi:hypothetical protein